ncbi:hypothetical protein [Streptacidiphilus cavernicola]|uniref:Glycosyltransferase RgtA/B/C/D-like domain-containing protein n=1 Tax=Streptacidiphilus cavernicola TaxID=3342716 RepID=A0ABV6VZ08_9ACTN
MIQRPTRPPRAPEAAARPAARLVAAPGGSSLRRALPALGWFTAVRAAGLLVLAAWCAAERRSPHQLLSARWDSLWYSDIARHGYHWPGYVATATTRGAGARSHLAFFPLLPWLERGIGALTGLAPADAGLAVSAVAALTAAWGIHTVAERSSGRRAAAVLVVLWAALPIGILLSMAYSEALFTALAAWALHGLLRGHWLRAGLLTALAGLTRVSAVALIAAVWVCAAAALWERRGGWPRILAGALLAPAGWLGYVLWTGGPVAYLRVQGAWGNGFDGGWAYGRYIWRQLSGSGLLTGAGVLVFVGLVLWAYWCCLRRRLPLALLVYTGVLTALALGAQAYFNSKPRLLLPAFPLLLPLALYLAGLRPARTTAVLALLALASAVYGAIWLLGPGPP